MQIPIIDVIVVEPSQGRLAPFLQLLFQAIRALRVEPFQALLVYCLRVSVSHHLRLQLRRIHQHHPIHLVILERVL